MTSNGVKILVVGVGSIGIRHLKNLLKLGYKNLTVIDSDSEKFKLISELGDFPHYTNLKIALKEQKPDIVFVCNPTHLHVSAAQVALDAGAHVFIEKPLSNSLKGIDALIKKARDKRKIAMVACNYRFNKGFKELENIVKSEKFGKPLTALAVGGSDVMKSRKTDYKKTYAASKKQGGGVILDSCSHSVEYLTALFGNIVFAKAFKKNIRKLPGIDVEDYVSMFLEHDSGVVTTLVSDYFSRPKKSFLDVQFQNGRAKWDFPNNIVESIDGVLNKTQVKKIYKDSEKDKARNDMYVDELCYFLNMVKYKKQPLQDLKRAKSIMKVLINAKKSF